MNDKIKKIVVVVVLLGAICAVIAAKQLKSKPQSKPEDNVNVTNKNIVKLSNETTAAEEVTSVLADNMVTVVRPAAEVQQSADENNPNKAKAISAIEKILAEPSLPRLLELGSVSCMPCKMMKPVIDALEKEYKGSMTVDFIDVWADVSAGKKYGVSSIPTQIFFDADGKELFRHQGFFAKEAILAKWKELGVDLEEAK